MFREKNSGNALLKGQLRSTLIPTQLKQHYDKEALENLGSSMSKLLQIALIIGLFGGLLFPGTISLVWSMINAIQLMTHVPLFSINFPANAQYFFAQLLKISVFDFFPADKISKDIYVFDKEIIFSPNFQVMGYENMDFI